MMKGSRQESDFHQIDRIGIEMDHLRTERKLLKNAIKALDAYATYPYRGRRGPFDLGYGMEEVLSSFRKRLESVEKQLESVKPCGTPTI
jgi:hypothetical protein